ncbi:MAG: DUF1684 domain-containing protein, partial [Bacteroidota bacterium]
MKKLLISLISLSLCAFTGCKEQASNTNEMTTEAYKKEMETWRAERLENLKSKDGWLNLAGLLWLEEGKNTLGSHPENTIQFPDNAPAHVGTLFMKDDNLTFIAHENLQVYNDSTPVDKIDLRSDASGEATELTHEPFSWFIIKRGEKHA